MSQSTGRGAASRVCERQDGLTPGKAVARRRQGGEGRGCSPPLPAPGGGHLSPCLVKLAKLHDCDTCKFPHHTHGG